MAGFDRTIVAIIDNAGWHGEASPASQTQVEHERRSLNRKILQPSMMQVMPSR